MSWNTEFPKGSMPTLQQISDYINHPAFDGLDERLRSLYQIEPSIEYSSCSMQPGWNVKYKKSGKALCTVYPQSGCFLVLLTIGAKEMTEAELFLPSCTDYIREVFQRTETSNGAKWLMLTINDTGLLDDLTGLIKIRKQPKK